MTRCAPIYGEYPPLRSVYCTQLSFHKVDLRHFDHYKLSWIWIVSTKAVKCKSLLVYDLDKIKAIFYLSKLLDSEVDKNVQGQAEGDFLKNKFDMDI